MARIQWEIVPDLGITRIEVVKIRPQRVAGEELDALIEDPWRVFYGEPSREGCQFTFSDPTFVPGGRDAVYYVRAIEEPGLAINAGNLRCRRDDQGRCLEVHRCGTEETIGDDCKSETEERAWSSPIHIDWPSQKG